MKIRADFVTNSSSSCYVTVVVETKDGRHFCGAFVGDEVGFYTGGIAGTEGFTLKDALNAATGKELLQVIDAAYDNLFSDHDELDQLFEEYEGSDLKAYQLKENRIKWHVGGQSDFETLPVSEIKSLRIIEAQNDDESGSAGEVTVDFVRQRERVAFTNSGITYDPESDGEIPVEREYEEVRDWKTGEVTVIKDEVNEIEEDDEDYDDEDMDEDE